MFVFKGTLTNLFIQVFNSHSYRRADFLFKMLLLTINGFACVNCLTFDTEISRIPEYNSIKTINVFVRKKIY